MSNKINERRKGPDFWIRFLKTLAVFSWIFMLIVLIILEKAKPQFETFFDRFYHLKLRTTWDYALAEHIYHIMFAGVLISAVGLAISFKRYRRKEDMYPVSLMLIGLFSLVGILLYKIYLLVCMIPFQFFVL